MFKTRLLSGIVLVLVALLTICSGGTVLYMTVLCLSLIGAGELFRVMKVREDKWNLLEITGYAGVVIFYLSLLLHDPMYQMLALILDLVLLMAVYVFTYPKYNANQVMPAFFAIVYVGVMLSYVYQTRMLDGGKFHVWLIFLCSWGCDTCAYCVGVLFGKHKMAPVLSPKKSVEGAVGGVVGGVEAHVGHPFFDRRFGEIVLKVVDVAPANLASIGLDPVLVGKGEPHALYCEIAWCIEPRSGEL